MTSKSLFLRISIFTSFLCSVFSISASEVQCKFFVLRKSLIAMHSLKFVTKFQYEGFAAGTIILTNNGLGKIEEVKVGDLVLSKDFENDVQSFCFVSEISKKTVPAYIEIILDHETIITAPGQKFYLDSLGKWVTAQKLQESLDLQLQFPALIMEIHKVDDPVAVYSLTVDDYHTFYITAQRLLVHNMNPELVFKTIDVGTNIFMMHVVPAVQYVAPIIGPAIGGWIATHVIKEFRGKKQGDFHATRYAPYDKIDKKNKRHKHKKKTKEKQKKSDHDGAKHQIGIS